MSTTPHDLVRSQFGATAAAYVASPVHAVGDDLDRVAQRAAERAPARALDLGAGGGHISYAIAPHAGAVTACDLSAEMLGAVAAEAARRGQNNISTKLAPAEALPFADASFEFVACRFSAHHWQDFEAGLRQVRRVLAPGGVAIFIDGIAPEIARADVHLQTVELLRDPSHGRDYNAAEWLAALARAGFTCREARGWRLRMDFGEWTARMRTSDLHIEAIRSLQRLAAPEVRERLAIEADGSFQLDVMSFEVS